MVHLVDSGFLSCEAPADARDRVLVPWTSFVCRPRCGFCLPVFAVSNPRVLVSDDELSQNRVESVFARSPHSRSICLS